MKGQNSLDTNSEVYEPYKDRKVTLHHVQELQFTLGTTSGINLDLLDQGDSGRKTGDYQANVGRLSGSYR